MLKRDDRLRFRVCWYPDQWPKERWSQDLRLMRSAGLECVRVGEGSWTVMQPDAERVEWSLVDEVLDLCARHGLGVLLGTPTYAAPAWLEIVSCGSDCKHSRSSRASTINTERPLATTRG